MIFSKAQSHFWRPDIVRVLLMCFTKRGFPLSGRNFSPFALVPSSASAASRSPSFFEAAAAGAAGVGAGSTWTAPASWAPLFFSSPATRPSAFSAESTEAPLAVVFSGACPGAGGEASPA